MTNPDLDADQLASLRQMLEQQRAELETLLDDGAGAADTVTLDQQSVGRVSRIDAIQQQQMALASQQQAAQTLRQIEAALRRIDAGEYGYCLQCGEAIGCARLQVQPFAALCLDCQSASETR